MKQITDLEEMFINIRIDFAKKFLLLPDKIELYFEDCPSKQFPSLVNAAESDDHAIYFNDQWYHMNITEHPFNVSYFIFHELRHIHQIMSIKRLHGGLTIQDPESDILEWEMDHNNYIRNEDENTQDQNLQQTIEKDANAYGICLTNLFYLGNENVDQALSIPEIAFDVAIEQSRDYYKSKLELKKFIDDYHQRMTSANGQKKTIHSQNKKKRKKKRKR